MTDLHDAANRAADEIARDADEPAESTVDPERTRELRTPGFSRMNTHVAWSSDDAMVVSEVRGIVDGRILTRFAGAYQIMNEIYDTVREPVVDGHGVIQTDTYGFAIWQRTATGAYVEDFSRIGSRDKEDWLFKITTALFEWEQNAADAWGEAMFAKAQWEERFAISFAEEHEGKDTIEGRTQSGRLGSRDERYFAIFLSLYSRKADSIVRSMERLAQRLKDTLD